jgi:hypothetical protein
MLRRRKKIEAGKKQVCLSFVINKEISSLTLKKYSQHK